MYRQLLVKMTHSETTNTLSFETLSIYPLFSMAVKGLPRISRAYSPSLRKVDAVWGSIHPVLGELEPSVYDRVKRSVSEEEGSWFTGTHSQCVSDACSFPVTYKYKETSVRRQSDQSAPHLHFQTFFTSQLIGGFAEAASVGVRRCRQRPSIPSTTLPSPAPTPRSRRPSDRVGHLSLEASEQNKLSIHSSIDQSIPPFTHENAECMDGRSIDLAPTKSRQILRVPFFQLGSRAAGSHASIQEESIEL